MGLNASTFDPTAPGPIGGTTPAAITGTAITATGLLVAGGSSTTNLHTFTTGTSADNVMAIQNNYASGHSAIRINNASSQEVAIAGGFGNSGVTSVYGGRVFFASSHPTQSGNAPDMIFTQESDTAAGPYSTYPRIYLAGGAQTITVVKAGGNYSYSVGAGDLVFMGIPTDTYPDLGYFTLPLFHIDGAEGPRNITSFTPAATAGTGTVSTSGWTVTGTGTALILESPIGSRMTIAGTTYTVVQVTSDTVAKVDNFIGTNTGVAFTVQKPSFSAYNSASNTAKKNERVSISGTGTLVVASDDANTRFVIANYSFKAWSLDTGSDGNLNFKDLFGNANPLILHDGAPDSTLQVLADGTVQTKAFRTSYTATATDYTVLQTDHIIGVTSTAAARVITLPSAATSGAGKEYIVKDESGLAVVNNITVKSASGTLDGVAAATGVPIITNYGSSRWYSNGANWFSF